ncbi:MAG TPA: hypothetical protein VKS60_04285 [Stellaceae bacterium]|nr:hypothetical protein [Stellaceae bacterium]
MLLAGAAAAQDSSGQDTGNDRFKMLHEAEKKSQEQQATPPAEATSATPAAPAQDAAPATPPAETAPAASAAPPSPAATPVAAKPASAPKKVQSEADLLTRKYNKDIFDKPKASTKPQS